MNNAEKTCLNVGLMGLCLIVISFLFVPVVFIVLFIVAAVLGT